LKAIIISAPIGSGHVRAGQAVGAALQSIDPAATVVYANVFDFFPAFIGNSVLAIYLKILSIFPQLYGMAYAFGNTSRLALIGRQLISRFLARQMLAYIKSLEPDVIICTHATPAGLVADLLHRGELTSPAVAIVTDFIVHRLWIYPEITHYCVANEELRQELLANGIPLHRSTASGIPVAAGFAGADAIAGAEASGLGHALPTIMIMGGGAGLLPMEDLIRALNSLEQRIRIIAVCGSNQKMSACLSKMANSIKHRLIVYNFVENIAELMAASDLLVTKPGGLTSAEALCCGLPLIIYRPIPGQEAENAKRLIQHGSALQADTPAALTSIVGMLLTEQERLAQMRQHSRAISKPDAAMVAAGVIRSLIVK
jgi:processive 1,2-diacylglycerol beta-glucosyltransferase